MRDKVASLLLADWNQQSGFPEAGHLEIINLTGATPQTYGWAGCAASTPPCPIDEKAAPMELRPIIERREEWRGCRVRVAPGHARPRSIRLVHAQYPADRSA